ncbi:hypothetical protein HOC29_03970 [archaeon]|jgi:hypothetical protein|nr:hypothetical protein [archaeon]MBT3720494.1 hypothetical protein [archaeon]MBT4532149.1 hypothetical protein [archaeon]
MQKGQVTIYVIIGLIIVIVIGIFYWSSNRQKTTELQNQDNIQTLNNHANMIKNYIEQCLSYSTINGIYLIGAQGGFIDSEYNEFYGDYDQVEWQRSGNLKIPYWYYNGMDISPSLKQVETKLGRFILIHGENCTRIEDLPSLEGVDILKPDVNYQETYFDFSLEESHINVSINDKHVSVKYFFPIQLEMDNDVKTVDEYYIEVPIAVGENFKIAKEILSKMESSDDKGYNVEENCADFSREGYTNVFPFNNRILLIDYEPYFNPKFGRSFKFQYLYSGVNVYGYCSG